MLQIRRHRSRRLLVSSCAGAGLALATLTAAAMASPPKATTFCVKASHCRGIRESSLPAAVSASAKHHPRGGAYNTIKLGPGTFPWAGTAQISASDPRVHIQGAGSSTILEGDSSSKTLVPVILIQNASTVSNLTVQLASGERLGLELSASSSADHVQISGDKATPGSVGVDLEGGASLTNSTVTMGLADDQTFTLVGPTAVNVELSGNSTVMAPSGASSGTARLSADQLTGAIGLGVEGGSAQAQQLNIKGTDFGLIVNAGSLTLDDALIQVNQPRQTSGAVGAAATALLAQSNAAPSLTVRQSTIVGDGGEFSAGLYAGPNGTISADSDVLSNIANSIRTSDNGKAPTGTVKISYSDFDPSTEMQNGTNQNSITSESGNVNVDPGFAGNGNFALTSGSQLINAGNPSEPVSGAPSVDLIGDPRVFGATSDIGACEYVGSDTPRCPGGQPLPGPRLSIASHKVRLSRGKISFTVSCPAGATDNCNGKITVVTVKAVGKHGRRHVTIKVGSANYSVNTGQKARVTIRVTGAFARALHHYGRLKVRASARPSSSSESQYATSRTFTVKR